MAGRKQSKGTGVYCGRKISEAFSPQGHLTHIYDMGTSSETEIKVVGVREGKPTPSRAIALMARNNTTAIPFPW